MNRFRLMYPALFIVFFTVTPLLLSPAGLNLNPTNPAPGMTPTAFRAIKIAALCFRPLKNLGIVSALAAVLVLVFGGATVHGVVRSEGVSVKLLKIAILSTLLSFECLVFIRLSPDSLLSGLCILHVVFLLVALRFFIHTFRG